MKGTRKKVKQKPVKPVKPLVPRKRAKKVESKMETIEKPKTINLEEDNKVEGTTKNVLNFVKLCDGSTPENRKNIGDRVMKGEIKWHHYIYDGSKGCHYYLILKTS